MPFSWPKKTYHALTLARIELATFSDIRKQWHCKRDVITTTPKRRQFLSFDCSEALQSNGNTRVVHIHLAWHGPRCKRVLAEDVLREW